MPETSFADRLFVAAIRRAKLDGVTLAVVRKAVSLVSLALAYRIVDLRNSEDPLLAAQGKIEESNALLGLYEEIAHILGERWDHIPIKRRPHYSPELRYRVLRVKLLLGLSCAETGRMFRVVPETISRWEKEAMAAPANKDTVGALIRPTPPVRRYADVVREVVLSMALVKVGGNGMIARTLARAGWKLSDTTVARYRKQPVPAPPEEQSAARALTARYPGHVWMTDITQLVGLFGITDFYIMTIYDAYSRMPLLTRTFNAVPKGANIAAMFRWAAKTYGRPKRFVCDRGVQFTSGVFTKALARFGLKPRYGAIGKHGSIALMERFWLTLKTTLQRLPFSKPLLWQDLDHAIHLSLAYYAFHRPHSALGGATPAEMYFNQTPAHLAAKHPPRGRPGEQRTRPPFRIAHLDAEGRFPILAKAA